MALNPHSKSSPLHLLPPLPSQEDSHHLLDYIPKEAAIVHRPNNLPSRFSMGPKQGEVRMYLFWF